MSAGAVLARAKAAMDSLDPVPPYGLGQYLTSNGAELPDEFIAYTLITGVPEQHADDEETQRTYRVQVSIYSRTGLAVLPDVDTAMKAQGFRLGPDRQLPYDADTRHFGLAKDYLYLM